MSTINSGSISDIENDAELENRLDAEAKASYAAGRVVPNARVVSWLQFWGAPEELPCLHPEAPDPDRD